MPGKVHLEVYTPTRQILNTMAEFVALPCESGELGILYNHQPIIMGLAIGALRYGELGDANHYLFVAGGFAEVRQNKVTVLADIAELAEEIDVVRAKAARDEALQRMREALAQKEFSRADLALQRAVTRLKVHDKIKL